MVRSGPYCDICFGDSIKGISRRSLIGSCPCDNRWARNWLDRIRFNVVPEIQQNEEILHVSLPLVVIGSAFKHRDLMELAQIRRQLGIGMLRHADQLA